ncbi:hypothetical protein [Shouchella rhizosphaerae]|uniref:Uncharacterized protein n=1 Tax=Shouchella rhizosphaerae TaxID=866786 RepID=A0ABZ2CWX3_9BACI
MKRLVVGSLLCAVLYLAEGEAFAKEYALENVNGIDFSDEEIEQLFSLAFTKDEILNMTEDEWNQNKNLEGFETVEVEQYLKITETVPEGFEETILSIETGDPETEESSLIQRKLQTSIDSVIETEIELISKEEFERESLSGSEYQVSANPTKSTSYKKMTTSITSLGNKKYRVKNNITWTKMPSMRMTDVNAVSIRSSDVRPVGGEYGKQTWKYKVTPRTHYKTGSAEYKSSSNKWKYQASGYSLKQNLKNDYKDRLSQQSYQVVELNLYMYYTIQQDGKASYIDAYGGYAHRTNPANASIGISTGGLSLSVTPSGYFSHHPTTHAALKVR